MIEQKYWALLLLLIVGMPLQADDLNFLKGHVEFEHARDMLPAYLNRSALALLTERERKVAAMSTPQDFAARRTYIRERLIRSIGGLPPKTPLNARTTATLDRDGYRIEKIVFESQPGFFVTANLYLPKSGQAPHPAVLFPLGHESGSKSHSAWQQMLITLVRRGYVAFAWDPLGQGERLQFYNSYAEDSELGHNRSTSEHTMLGLQTLLVGDNLARYTIWDGIRALDYLLSRPEVDSNRVAVTGNSGGGTHSTYLAALDDRIKVAAPSCYITSWRMMLATIGPQDAEQLMQPFLADGLDYADFIYAAAPKPFLMMSAIRDFFPISGARATFAEVGQTLSRLGTNTLSMFEADDGHGYTLPRREAAYAWLGKWLQGKEDKQSEAPVALESEEQLQVTPSGQVATSLNSETVFSLNLKRLPKRESLLRSDLEERVRNLTGYERRSGPVKITPYGSVQRDRYRIDKLIYETEPGIFVPALLFVPDAATKPLPAIVYLNGKGKALDAAPNGEIERLVSSGAIVLSIDPRGMGETAVTEAPDGQRYSGYFGDYADSMLAVLQRKTLVGMRATDVSRAVDLLAARSDVAAANIYGVGKGAGAIILLHAATLDSRIQRVVLSHMTVSFESIVRSRIHQDLYESVVPGVLASYDLPDLAAMLSPRKVWLVDAVNPLGNPVSFEQLRQLYAPLIAKSMAPKSFHLVERLEPINTVYKQLLQ